MKTFLKKTNKDDLMKTRSSRLLQGYGRPCTLRKIGESI